MQPIMGRTMEKIRGAIVGKSLGHYVVEELKVHLLQ